MLTFKFNNSQSFNAALRMVALFIFASFMMLAFSSVAFGQVDGFTEPFRKIELSSDESGAIASLHVEVGDLVGQGEVIASLDQRVQEIQLEIADHMANSQSQMNASKETLEKREAIAKRLQELKKRGFANESEIIRADMELTIAKARYLSAMEDLEVRKIEKKRAEIQLKRRQITAPFDGIVAEVHRREGEFLSPLRPEVVTLIQVDQLLASFAIPSGQVSMLKLGQEYELVMETGKTIKATVYRIGVETDAQSGTVEVKLVIDNSDFSVRSGEIVTLKI